MIRLPINLLVQKCGRELTKPKPKPETTTLATGVRIHYVDFEKIRKYKEVEMKKLPNTFPKGGIQESYSRPFKR